MSRDGILHPSVPTCARHRKSLPSSGPCAKRLHLHGCLSGVDVTRRPAEGTVGDLRIVRAPAAGHHAAPSPIVRLATGTRKAAESAPAPDAKRERCSPEAHRSPSAGPGACVGAPAEPLQGSTPDLSGAAENGTVRASSRCSLLPHPPST